MIKHRLMDVRAVAIKSAVYTTLIGLIAAIYFFVAFYLKKQYENIIGSDVIFIAAFALALAFNPLRKVLQKQADKVFYKGRYNFEDLLKNLSNTISHSLDLNELSKQLLTTLSAEMKIAKSTFVLKSGYCANWPGDSSPLAQNDAHGDLASSSSRPKAKGSQVFANKDAFLKIATSNQALVADELEDDNSKKQLMRNSGVEVLVYFYDEERALGFLALSEKTNGDAFSAQDLKLLEIIAPQISIALKNIEQQQQMIEQIVEERQRIH